MQFKNGYRIPISTSKHIVFNDGGHITCLHAPHVGIHTYKVKNWNKITFGLAGKPQFGKTHPFSTHRCKHIANGCTTDIAYRP